MKSRILLDDSEDGIVEEFWSWLASQPDHTQSIILAHVNAIMEIKWMGKKSAILLLVAVYIFYLEHQR